MNSSFCNIDYSHSEKQYFPQLFSSVLCLSVFYHLLYRFLHFLKGLLLDILYLFFIIVSRNLKIAFQNISKTNYVCWSFLNLLLNSLVSFNSLWFYSLRFSKYTNMLLTISLIVYILIIIYFSCLFVFPELVEQVFIPEV